MSQPAFDFDDAADDEAADPTYSVGELTDAINRSLRRSFGGGVWVRGEIQGWSARGPHAYFTLADDTDGDRAVLNVQFFAPARARLRPLLARSGLDLADGLRVRIFGHLDVYAPTGRLGLKMVDIDPRFTLGELAMARAAVIQRLVASGAYDVNRSRQLTPVPTRVGVVTSVGTAAWHDFRHVVERSGLGFRLTAIDTRVQGDTAVRAVTASIRSLAARADLDAIVVIRGGGARSDLATFDAEEIALAIAASPVPVLTGLGHEIDRSVADEVAHTAFTTPTACANALVEAVGGYVQRAEAAWAGIERRALDQVARSNTRLTELARRIGGRSHAAIERADDRLDDRLERVRVRAPQVLDQAAQRLGSSTDLLRRTSDRLLVAEDRRVASLAAQLALLDPAVLLARGWSITRTTDGQVVRHVHEAPPGTLLETRLAHGTLTSRVTDGP